MDKTFSAEIYKQLIAAVEKLPDAAVERSKDAQTRKGYDTTGYQYQFLVNVLNEIVGVPNWSAEYHVIKEIEGAFKSGQKNWEITVDMKVTILDAVRVNAGGHKAALHSDALKGAITSALKKTLGLFGVGKKAYEGTIDDDNRPLPSEDGDKTPKAKIGIPQEKPAVVVADKKPAEKKSDIKMEDIATIYGARQAKVGSVVKCIRALVEKVEARKVKSIGQDVTDFYINDHTTPDEGDNMLISKWGAPPADISIGQEVDFLDVKIAEYKGVKRGSCKIVREVK